jgi:hypothetical protein
MQCLFYIGHLWQQLFTPGIQEEFKHLCFYQTSCSSHLFKKKAEQTGCYLRLAHCKSQNQYILTETEIAAVVEAHVSYSASALREERALSRFQLLRLTSMTVRNKTEQKRRGLRLEQMRTSVWLPTTLNNMSDTLQLLSMKSMLPRVFRRGWERTMFEKQKLSTSAHCNTANKQPNLQFAGGRTEIYPTASIHKAILSLTHRQTVSAKAEASHISSEPEADGCQFR